MSNKEKSEIRVRLENALLILVGLLLVAGMISVHRGGLDWFANIHWSGITPLRWVALVLTACVTLVLQYYVLLLLRYSFFRHLFWLLPAIWLVSNGMTVINRFIEGEYGRALTGWIPLTDLGGWLIALVYFPVLIGGGIAAAVADSGGFIMSQACAYAHAVLETARTASSGMWPFIQAHLGAFKDILLESFKHQVAAGQEQGRAFLDFGREGLFRLPHWLLGLGYTFSCIAL